MRPSVTAGAVALHRADATAAVGAHRAGTRRSIARRERPRGVDRRAHRPRQPPPHPPRSARERQVGHRGEPALVLAQRQEQVRGPVRGRQVCVLGADAPAPDAAGHRERSGRRRPRPRADVPSARARSPGRYRRAGLAPRARPGRRANRAPSPRRRRRRGAWAAPRCRRAGRTARGSARPWPAPSGRPRRPAARAAARHNGHDEERQDVRDRRRRPQGAQAAQVAFVDPRAPGDARSSGRAAIA